MKIDLTEVHKSLETIRAERGLTANSQKKDYIVNVMEKFGELALAIKDHEKYLQPDWSYPTDVQEAELEIAKAICDIAILTLNVGAEVFFSKRVPLIDTSTVSQSVNWLSLLISDCADFECYEDYNSYVHFYNILMVCAKLCEQYGFNFQLAMEETVKEISSYTGSYDENTKKWERNDDWEAQTKWYRADYGLARIEKEETNEENKESREHRV